MAEPGNASPVPTPVPNVGKAGINNEQFKFSYLPPPDYNYYDQQGLREKLIKKTKENPFVPLGVIFTTVVLGMGLWSMRSHNSRKSQLLMRLRVGGQAFAIFAMLAGVYYHAKTGKSDQ